MGVKYVKKVCPFCFADCDVALPGSQFEVFPEQYCVKCKSRIPAEIVYSRLFPIAVVGPSGSGKTHFLTVLSHLLCVDSLWPEYWDVERIIKRRRSVVDEDASVLSGALLDDEFLEWEECLYPHKGKKGTILRQTVSRTATEPPLSLVIHVSYSKKGVSSLFREPFRKKDRDLLLAFTDTAGEDLQRMGWTSVAEKYPILGRNLAEGIIALVNPTQLFYIKEDLKIPAVADLYAQSGVSETVLAPLQDVLSIREIRVPMKRKPLAVCLAKTEALITHKKIDTQDFLANPPNIVLGDPDGGRINLTEITKMSEAVVDFLGRMDNGNDKIDKACQNFRYRAFFPTDALGNVIETAQNYEGVRMFTGTPQPRCVMEPLLWILWQHGLIGGRYV